MNTGTKHWRDVLAQAERAVILDFDGEERWGLTGQLCDVGHADLITEAARLLTSDAWPLRDLGTSLLQQLIPGTTETSVRQNLDDPRIPVLLAAALDDPSAQVVMTAIYRTGHLNLVAKLLGPRFHKVSDPNAGIRQAMASVLDGLYPDPRVLPTLFVLMEDDDDEVRNWATFCLGAQLDGVDTPEVRDALAARLADPEPEVVFEAASGLQARGDPRGNQVPE